MKKYIQTALGGVYVHLDEPRILGVAVADMIFGLAHFEKYFLPAYEENLGKGTSKLGTSGRSFTPDWQHSLIARMFEFKN